MHELNRTATFTSGEEETRPASVSKLSPVHMSCATLLHAISEGRENEETFSYSGSLLQIWYNWVDASILVVYWVTYPLPGCVLFSKEIF